MNIKKIKFIYIPFLLCLFFLKSEIVQAAQYMKCIDSGNTSGYCEETTITVLKIQVCYKETVFNTKEACEAKIAEETAAIKAKVAADAAAAAEKIKNTKWFVYKTSNPKQFTCKSGLLVDCKVANGCLPSTAQDTLDLCIKLIKESADGNEYVATSASAAAADASAAEDAKIQAEEDALKQKYEANKKAAADEVAAAASIVCNCNAKDPQKQCRDDFKSVSEAIDYCVSCGLPAPTVNLNKSVVKCPLGSKEIGSFSCTCGVGEDKKCANFGTYKELTEKCLAPCGQANGACSIDTSVSLQNLKKDAQKLNPAGFAIGKAGVIEIIGKLISFLLFPIGMFTMALYIWAGFLWMTAQGNSENVNKSKQILVWTTLGVVISLASYLIVKLVFTEIL